MALIKCPECGKEISSYAAACPNCGYPIQNPPTGEDASAEEKVIEQPKEIKNLMVCPVCALIIDQRVTKCCVPTQQLVEIDFTIEEYHKRLNAGLEQYTTEDIRKMRSNSPKEYQEKYGKRRHQNILDTDRYIYNNYIKPLGLGDLNSPRFRENLLHYGIRLFTQPTPPPKPKCPICGSENLSKISTMSKVAKAATFGLFAAGDMSKTWKCNNCGSKF